MKSYHWYFSIAIALQTAVACVGQLQDIYGRQLGFTVLESNRNTLHVWLISVKCVVKGQD